MPADYSCPMCERTGFSVGVLRVHRCLVLGRQMSIEEWTAALEIEVTMEKMRKEKARGRLRGLRADLQRLMDKFPTRSLGARMERGGA
jgi:hypothetical protein